MGRKIRKPEKKSPHREEIFIPVLRSREIDTE